MLPHLPPSRYLSREDSPAGPIRLKGGPYVCLCCSSSSPDHFSPSGPQFPQRPQSSPEAENPPNFPRARWQAWRVGTGQEATEGVKERKISTSPQQAAPPFLQRGPPLVPTSGPCCKPHPEAHKQLTADSRLSPEGGHFKASQAPLGWATGLWPEGFVSGTQETTRDGGGFPCFPVSDLFNKHLRTLAVCQV